MNWDTAPQELESLRAQVAALTEERDRWQEDSMRQAATINRMFAATEDRNEVDRLRHAEHEKELATMTKELKYEKMNTEVWRRDAEGKLEDRTAAYHELAAAQAHIAQLRELLPHELPNNFIGMGKHYAEQAVKFAPPSDSMSKFKRKWFADCAEALAIPTDTATLDARLAQERERCAELLLRTDLQHVPDKWKQAAAMALHTYATAIREMK
jgi:hypothetical protein